MGNLPRRLPRWRIVSTGRRDTLVFSSGHLLRVLAVRWLGIDGAMGRYLLLDPAGISVLGYQRELAEPVIRLWNDRRHLHDARGVE